MRSAYGPEKFLLASKKSKIIDLVKRATLMTNEEISNLNEKPDVIKGLLNIKAGAENKEAMARAEAIADAMIEVMNRRHI